MLKFIIAAALVATGSTPALADRDDAAPTARVHYGDLNLASQEGRAVLQRRLGRAVDTLCGPTRTADLFETLEVNRCKVAAMRSAAPQIAAITKNVAFASASPRFEGGSR